jgi:hypothetical protein
VRSVRQSSRSQLHVGKRSGTATDHGRRAARLRVASESDQDDAPAIQSPLLANIAQLAQSVDFIERSIHEPPSGMSQDQIIQYVDARKRVLATERAALASMTKDLLGSAVEKNDVWLGRQAVLVGRSYAPDVCDILCKYMHIIKPEFVSDVFIANGIRLAANPAAAPAVASRHAAPMIRAAAIGRSDMIALLACDVTGLKVTDRDEMGRTPLHAAAAANMAATTNKLLNMGAQPLVLDSEGNSAVLLAIASGKIDALRVILDYEAEPFDTDQERSKYFSSTMYSKLVTFAAMRSHTSALRELIQRGAIPEVGIEFMLVREGKVDSLAILIDSELVSASKTLSAERMSLLQVAIKSMNNRESIVRLLLSRDVPVHERDLQECTDPAVRHMLEQFAGAHKR